MPTQSCMQSLGARRGKRYTEIGVLQKRAGDLPRLAQALDRDGHLGPGLEPVDGHRRQDDDPYGPGALLQRAVQRAVAHLEVLGVQWGTAEHGRGSEPDNRVMGCRMQVNSHNEDRHVWWMTWPTRVETSQARVQSNPTRVETRA